jgi:osmotically-inducible protein OsmY
MANRQQDNQTPSRQGRYRSDENDDNSRSSSEYGRDYGQYRDTDEGDSSVRAGSYDQGRNQGGSSGRYSGYGDFGRGNYSGQDRYGQSGGSQSNYNQEWSGYDQNSGRGGSDEYSRSRGTQQSRFGGYGGYGGQSGAGSHTGYGSQRGFGEGSTGQGWSDPFGESQRGGQSGGMSGGSQGSQYGQYGGQSGFGGGSQSGYGGGGQGSFGAGSQSGYGGGSQYGYGGSGQGLHRGKGPKNFQRSDERIKELICERLTEDPDVDASEVTLNVQGGKITLEGTVDSRQTKMKVEDIAEQFSTNEVQNNLRVQKQGQSSSESGGAKSSSALTSGAGKSALSGEDAEQSKQKRN